MPKVTQRLHCGSQTQKEAGGGGRGRQRAPRRYLVQSGCDEGEEDQPPHGAAHDERDRVVHLIWLHLGLCLGQGRGRGWGGATGETGSGCLEVPQPDLAPWAE